MVSIDQRVETWKFRPRGTNAARLLFGTLCRARYSLEVSPTQPWYVRSATSGTTDLLREALVVGAGRRLEPLELVLRDDGASLKVKVLADEQPAAGSVLLFPTKQRLRMRTQVRPRLGSR